MRTFEQIRKDGDLLYESIRGSHLYGLNTEDSDIDTFGLYSASKEEFLGTGLLYAPLVTSEKNDDAWSELSKFIKELSKSNPNALEAIFTPPEYVQHYDPILDELWAYRDKLLTKECFKAFHSYAISQLGKAKGLNKLINTDPEEVKVRKSPLEFCWVPRNDKDGTTCILEWLSRRHLKPEHCGATHLRNCIECYSVYYDWGADPDSTLENYVRVTYGEREVERMENYREEFEREIKPGRERGFIKYRGLLDPNHDTTQIRCSSISVEDAIHPLCAFQFNVYGFTDHCTKYKRYWEWVDKRNPVRYENNLGHDYDSKNLMHVIRLLTSAKEIAEGQGFILDRRGRDREFLLSIKHHGLSYEEIMKYCTNLKEEMLHSFEMSKLPDSPDPLELNQILFRIRERRFGYR